MNYGHNLDPDMEKLISLLKKILKKHPPSAEQLAKLGDSKAFNLNICFLTFIPMSPDEMDELNDIYEEYLNRGDDASTREEAVDLEFRLTGDDLDFLKNNGLSF